MAKEKGTLADRVLQATYLMKSENYGDKHLKLNLNPIFIQYRNWMKQSTRFVLSDELVEMACQLATQDTLAGDMLHIARLPFNVVWFEYDQHHLYRTMDKLGFAIGNIANIHTASKQSGTLMVRDPNNYTRYTCFKFDDSSKMNRAEVDSVCTVIDTENPIGKDYSLFGVEVLTKHMFKAAFSKQLAGEILKESAVDAISKMSFVQSLQPCGFHAEDIDMAKKYPWILNVSMASEPIMSAISHAIFKLEGKKFDVGTDVLAGTMANSCKEQRGHARFLIAVLSLINEVPVITNAVPATGYKTVGMNKIRYMSYSNILLKVPKTEPTRFVLNRIKGAIDSRRRHKVRGHWAHSHLIGKKNCDHVWLKLTENREECNLCGKLRWWRKEHMRGDATKGYVDQHYVVEAA